MLPLYFAAVLAAAPEPADLIVHHARVVTVDARFTVAGVVIRLPTGRGVRVFDGTPREM